MINIYPCIHVQASKLFGFSLCRLVPIDMAGFAINVRDILQKPTVWMGYKQSKTSILKGEVESCFLEYFVEDQSQLECRGSETEVNWYDKL